MLRLRPNCGGTSHIHSRIYQRLWFNTGNCNNGCNNTKLIDHCMQYWTDFISISLKFNQFQRSTGHFRLVPTEDKYNAKKYHKNNRFQVEMDMVNKFSRLLVIAMHHIVGRSINLMPKWNGNNIHCIRRGVESNKEFPRYTVSS